MHLLCRWQDYVLLPLYFGQAKRLGRQAIYLPEPTGARSGVSCLADTKPHSKTLSVMIVGDSAAAGVGVATQDEAMLGYLRDYLSVCPNNINKLTWQLFATSGHTSFELLTRLYALPVMSVDVVVVSIGVNDVIKGTSLEAWRANLVAIITLLKRKFSVHHILFLHLPPMQLMPSLPKPLSELVGRQAKRLNDILQTVCLCTDGVYGLGYEFGNTNDGKEEEGCVNAWQDAFAIDGFHPSAITYDRMARMIANKIQALML